MAVRPQKARLSISAFYPTQNQKGGELWHKIQNNRFLGSSLANFVQLPLNYQAMMLWLRFMNILSLNKTKLSTF